MSVVVSRVRTPVRATAGASAFTRARPLLGTLVEVSVAGLPPEAANAALESAFAWIERVHELMSFQSSHSEVTQLNRRALEAPVPVSEPTWEVLQCAREISRVSGGLFDITVGAQLVDLGLLPRHDGATGASRTRGNWQDVHLLAGRRVRFARPLCLDLSGIAKGYAVDRAIDVLRASGAGAGHVNAGGDLRCFGSAPQTVQVRHPGQPGVTLPLLQLHERAAATSAHYFVRRDRAGQSASALIHPKRGTPLTADLSVTVLADNCMLADALTKVVHADAQRALEVLAHFRADALLLQLDPDSGDCTVLDTREHAALRVPGCAA